MIVNISLFENTSLKIAYVNENSEYENAKQLIKNLLEKNSKLIISFSNQTLFHSDIFLNTINKYLPKNVIFLEGIGNKNKFLICNDKIYNKGIVGVSLNSDNLNITTNKYLNAETSFIYCNVTNINSLNNLIKEKTNSSTVFLTSNKFIVIKNNNISQENLINLIVSEKKSHENKIFYNISKFYKKIDKLIKEIKTKTKHLQAIEEKYSKLISMMNEGVLIIDKNFRIQTINDAFLRMSQCKKCDKCVKCKNTNTHIDKFLLNFSQKYKNGKFSFETKLIKSTELKDVLVNISEIENKNFLITVSDISKIKRMEKELLEQYKIKQMGDMINMIAHQWRQPINALSAIGIILEMKANANALNIKDIKEKAKIIQKLTQNISKTIDDFLNFSKNTSEITTFTTYDILKEIVKMIKPQLKQNDIKLIIKPGAKIKITSYKNDILQILVNILINAKEALINYNTKNKQIKLKTYIKENFLYIEIEDNAGGIDKQILNRIFEPYFTTKSPQNSGIGLYISKRMAKERLNGDIFAQNTEKGAKFTLKIPMN